MTLFQDITLAVVLAVAAAVVVEHFRSNTKVGTGGGANGNTSSGNKGFKFTIELDRK